jgi:hypothetical protein
MPFTSQLYPVFEPLAVNGIVDEQVRSLMCRFAENGVIPSAIVTDAEPDFFVLDVSTAVTVTVAGLGIVVGAV